MVTGASFDVTLSIELSSCDAERLERNNFFFTLSLLLFVGGVLPAFFEVLGIGGCGAAAVFFENSQNFFWIGLAGVGLGNTCTDFLSNDLPFDVSGGFGGGAGFACDTGFTCEVGFSCEETGFAGLLGGGGGGVLRFGLYASTGGGPVGFPSCLALPVLMGVALFFTAAEGGRGSVFAVADAGGDWFERFLGLSGISMSTYAYGEGVVLWFFRRTVTFNTSTLC